MKNNDIKGGAMYWKSKNQYLKTARIKRIYRHGVKFNRLNHRLYKTKHIGMKENPFNDLLHEGSKGLHCLTYQKENNRDVFIQDVMP